MYKEIEEIYKKQSPYNIIKKKIFWIYLLFMVVSLVFNIYNKILLMIIVLFVMISCMKLVCEKNLKIKLYLVKTNEKNLKPLNLIIKEEELKLFRDYSIRRNLYNEKLLLCIISHYRNVIKTRIFGGNLLAVLSLVLPICLEFCTKDGFDFMRFSNAIPYLIVFCLMIVIAYMSFNELIGIKKFLKGEDEMEERLEEIFSELYVDYINKIKRLKGNRNIKRQIKSKKINSKTKA